MYYKDQHVLLASMHEKEQVIAAPFKTRLSCELKVHDFDTDQFGTFTGEIARPLSPYETCHLKAKMAAERYDYHLAVASEGSFGPDPSFPFVPCDHELMVFIDKSRDWVIAEQLVSTNTNYATITINQHTNLDSFLKKAQFPSHAVAIKSTFDNRVIAKGINNLQSLTDHLNMGFKTEKELILTTDMRAMVNPTRMKVIGELADKLALRIATLCVRCTAPGFGFKSTKGALPCSDCGAPTSFYEHEVWACISCDHQEFNIRKDGLLEAEPTYCNYCNP